MTVLKWNSHIVKPPNGLRQYGEFRRSGNGINPRYSIGTLASLQLGIIALTSHVPKPSIYVGPFNEKRADARSA